MSNTSVYKNGPCRMCHFDTCAAHINQKVGRKYFEVALADPAY